MNIIRSSADARNLVQQGKIIAYPTEAIYGLGCDPFNKIAVEKLLALKQRTVSKGLIILIADWSQLAPLIGVVPDSLLDVVRETWPGPVTWVFPKSAKIPAWLSGDHQTIAVRMSAHPVARELCADGPVVSTSANINGGDPAVDIAGIYEQFPAGIDALLDGPLGGASLPSAIYDVMSTKRLR